MSIGNYLLKYDDSFVCIDDTELLPLDNDGATFLFVYTVFILSFTVMIWLAIYKIPDYYGLITKVRQPRVTLQSSTRKADDESVVTDLLLIARD